ncbi:MAG: Rrf2 family transcriptional regulator [Candidatus Omnitrophica bacterium]|nr:Rrf2 family transcriptional regulator [Candidatus Omnitrophota bacterium]
MKLTTKSEYALICLKYLYEHSNGKPISVAEVSEEERLSRDYVEQILVRLRRAGLIKSVKGIGGGFMLAREASQITLLQTIEAVEGGTFEIFCAPRLRERIVCEHFDACSVRPVWRKLKQLIDDFCGSLSLEALFDSEDTLEKKFDLLPFEKLKPMLSKGV